LLTPSSMLREAGLKPIELEKKQKFTRRR